jgi:hypothetical protein
VSLTDSYIGTDSIKFAPVALTADGDATAIAASTGKRICVLSYVLTNATTAGLVILKDTGGTLATFSLPLNGSVSYAGSIEAPAFQTGSGLALTLNNGTGVDTYGHISYILT